jgi:threonyl-tRNA synthetase
MVIGPVIDEGFYYDIYSPKPFTMDDVAAIEARMKELIAKDYDVIKKMTPRAEVIDVFSARGEDYKLRLVEDMPNETGDGSCITTKNMWTCAVARTCPTHVFESL